RRRGRLDRRDCREPGRGISRSLCRWRHQGLRSLRVDDHRADVQALRHLRPPAYRTHLSEVRKAMINPESGVFKVSYAADMAVFPLPVAQWTMAALTFLFVVIVPLAFSEYHLSIANLVMIAVIGALGLNILVGYTGQISIGHGALMSVGAYTAANLIT